MQTTSRIVNALAINNSHLLRPGKTILLVEDEAFVREMVYEILVAAGYRVLKCANAIQARSLFHQCDDLIDLLITDIVLPGESGHELARDLLKVDSELKIILTSGYPEKLKWELCTACNQVFCLPKPFTSESLVQKVAYVTSAPVGEVAI